MKSILSFIFLLIICSNSFGQNESDISFNQDEIERLKIYPKTFQYGTIHLSEEQRHEPCFRDYNKNSLKLDIVNPKTGKTAPLTNGKTKRKNLKVKFERIILNRENNEITIEGTVKGGWYGAGSDVDIYIGEKVDTTSLHILSPNLHYTIIHEGKELKEPIVLDTFPAFYLRNYAHTKSDVGRNYDKKRDFKIVSKINKNSVLTFGLSVSYSEIFEIGKLLAIRNDDDENSEKK
ncbi:MULTISPECIES: hypothetical protein [Lacinutrix]|uniref:hypothetical protein n=1 Tax=Lacinutrix algicola TaxID=342954 RepID=UPI0006E137F9|nr:hypothetical protein [Lacinutrix algicola]